MKKSELIARYRHFGEDLIPITNREFFDVLRENSVDQKSQNIDLDTDLMVFNIDGWDYYNYSSCYKVGYGNTDVDVFQFKIKRMTEKDRIVIKEIFSRRNNYTVFEEVAIGGEDFQFDVEDFVAL